MNARREGDDVPRVTLRGEFLRAERHLARAVAAEAAVDRLTALSDRLSGRLAEVEAERDHWRQEWEDADARRITAETTCSACGAKDDRIDSCGHPNHGAPAHDCEPFRSCLPSLGEPCGNCHRCAPDTLRP